MSEDIPDNGPSSGSQTRRRSETTNQEAAGSARWNGWVTLAWLATMVWGGVTRRIPELPVLGMTDFLEALGHFLQPMLLSALVCDWLTRSRAMQRRPAAFLAITFASVTTVLVEMAQLLVPERSVDPVEPVLGISGAVVGAAAYVLLTLPPALRSVTPRLLTVVGTAATVLLITSVATQPPSSSIDGLACVGQSQVPEPEPIALAAKTPRLEEGLVVAYDFSRDMGETFAPVAGSALELKIAASDGVVSNVDRGVVLSGGRDVLRSTEDAGTIVERLESSDALTLEAWVRPARLQSGPARIVSISGSTDMDDIDVQLGQEDTCVSSRLRVAGRTEWVLSEGGFTDTDLVHVAISFRQGHLSVLVDGSLIHTTRLRSGDLSGWSHGHHLLIGNEETVDRGFAGDIRFIAIYDRALTPEEVAANYSSGPPA